MSSPSAPAPSAVTDELWLDITRQALALAEALRAIAPGQPPKTQAACVSYASLVDEIAHLSRAKGADPPSSVLTPGLSSKQLQDFGRLLRDKRNQAGLSRLQLARKAKVSDATIKFIETARNPPSRATLLRLVGVPELGLRWADTPGYRLESIAQTSPDLPGAEFSRFDSRLTLPVVLEAVLVLDELHIGQYAVELTAYGARRLCCLCGARSEAWTLEAREAVNLPIDHATPCAGQFADSFFKRFPMLAELAHEERRSLRSLTATAIVAGCQQIHRERFYGCRSGAEVTAQLARGASRPSTPYEAGVGAMLLWALGLGPCPVEPTQKPFSEPRAHQLARLARKQRAAQIGQGSRLRGISDAAAWLVGMQEPEPWLEPASPLPSEQSQP